MNRIKAIALNLILFTQTLFASYDLSLVAIFQNESPYLKEWIEFHRLMGVEHFWLYNNLSNDNYKEVLNPYVEKGIVELIEWPYAHNTLLEWNAIQCGAYNDCCKRAEDKTKWLIVLDTDEFMFPVKKDKISEFLRDYEDQVGIGVNWVMYGTSFVPFLAPGDLLIEKLTLRAKDTYYAHTHIKSIVKPKYVAYFDNPHYATYKMGYSQVNAHCVPFAYHASPYWSTDLIRINHYWCRDQHFMWNNKFTRRVKWTTNYERDKQFWIKQEQKMNRIEDKSIYRFIPDLKKLINLHA